MENKTIKNYKKNLNNTSNIPFEILIQPARGWTNLNLFELWKYKELLYFLIWRDYKVRYKQTILGVAWAILQPFFTMVVFTIFFGRLGKIPSDGIPYPVFTFVALLPWQFFSHALTESSNSLVTNQQLVTKVYFPRLVIPISAVLGGGIDFCINFIVLLLMMFYYHITPTIKILTIPIFILLTVITALAVSLWLSALNVKYRDIRYTISFLAQFWLFITPIAYSGNIVPESWRPLYGLNPMAGVVEGFRWALLGTKEISWFLVGVSIIEVSIILVGGLIYFRRMEQTFADII